MRHAWKVVLIAILLVFCVPFAMAAASMIDHMQHRGPMMGGVRRYDPATEMTVKGTVEAVTTKSHMNGMENIWLTVKTDKETMEVRVGPTWFLAQKNMFFAKGDKVEMTGSQVRFETGEWLIAREVKMGGQKLTLRDKDGRPMWFSKGNDWRDRIGMPRGMT
jgi:hypothetical protein